MYSPEKKDKGVSVIIPVFNRPDFLKEAIDSALSQSYANNEIIVVDDGSTDATPSVIDSYGDSIKKIRQDNKGVSSARNTGIRASKYDFISFLDSDDLWMKNKLERQVSFFEENRDAIICQTGEIWVRKGKKVNPCKKHVKPSGMIFEQSLHLCLVSPSAVMMRKAVFDDFGFFNEDFPACEDYDLWLRISCSAPIYLLEENLVVKRGGHGGQLSAMDSLDKYRILSIAGLVDSGRLNDSQYEAAVRMLKEKCRIYSSGCLKRGKNEEAEEFVKIALKYGQEISNI